MNQSNATNQRQRRQCSATNRNGRPCQAWATRDSDPPLCSTHSKRNTGAGAPAGNQNRQDHGFYGRHYSLDEIADLIAYAADMTLADEIAAVRVATRRVFEKINTGMTLDQDPNGDEFKRELTAEEYAKLSILIFQGASTTARLLRAQRALTGDAADGIAGAIGQALDELANEWGIEL
jgi:hypothetical protein